MKKSIFAILLGCSLLSSCKDEPFLDGHDYDVVMNFKDAGLMEFGVFSFQRDQDIVMSLVINKGGCIAGSTPIVSLLPFTEQELEDYSANAGSEYKLIPADYYTMPSEVEFAQDETYKKIQVIFKGSLVDLLDDGNEYMLPIKIETNLGVVNENKKIVYFKPILSKPVITGKNTEFQTCEFKTDNTDSQSYGFDYSLGTESSWDFSINVETDINELQKLVNTYNEEKKINCSLLPEGYYDLSSTLDFNKGDNKKTLSAVVKNTDDSGTKLSPGDYLLPIKNNGIADPNLKIQIDANVSYIHVFVNDGYSLNSNRDEVRFSIDDKEGQTDGSGRPYWGTVSTNSQASGDRIEKLVDWNSGTHWHSWWKGGDGDITNDPEHGHDPVYGVYVDLKLYESVNIENKFSLGYFTRSSANNAVPALIRIYIGNNENDLFMAHEYSYEKDNLPTAQGAWYRFSDISLYGKDVKLVRVSFMQAMNGTTKAKLDLTKWDKYGSNSVSLGELYFFAKHN